jgi:putative thioredoxin
MGEEVLASGDAERAENIFRPIADMDPDHPEVAGGLARALIALGRPDEARTLLDSLPEAVAGDPAVARARAALDIAATPAADTSGLEQRLAANPDNHEARLELGNALMAAGRRDEAADALLELVRRDRDWNEGAARTRFLQLLEAQGLEDPWARSQRRRLSALLFT